MLRLTLAFGTALGAFWFLRVLPEIRAQRSVRRMQPDHEGNYDLDGVSYDPVMRNTVVTGDGRVAEPQRTRVEEVVTLHAPEASKPRDLTA